MPPTFSDDEKKKLLEAIERFWFDETGEEIGIIASGRIFEFFNGLLGSAGYNQGVADCQAYLQTKLVDMEIDLNEQVKFKPQD